MEGYIGKQPAPVAPLAPGRVQEVQRVQVVFLFRHPLWEAAERGQNHKESEFSVKDVLFCRFICKFADKWRIDKET